MKERILEIINRTDLKDKEKNRFDKIFYRNYEEKIEMKYYVIFKNLKFLIANSESEARAMKRIFASKNIKVKGIECTEDK